MITITETGIVWDVTEGGGGNMEYEYNIGEKNNRRKQHDIQATHTLFFQREKEKREFSNKKNQRQNRDLVTHSDTNKRENSIAD